MNNHNKLTDHKTRIKYGWELYRNFIKKRDINDPDDEVSDDEKLEAANEIISLCKPMEPYTPYSLTCLSVAEYYLQNNDCDKAKVWLTKLDKPLLENDTLKYINRFKEEMYWSQLRKYYELKSEYFLLTNDSDKFIWINFCLLEQCNNSKSQTQQINNSIYDEILKNKEINQENLVDSLLRKRGFLNEKTREEYRIMLYSRFKSYSHIEDKQAIFCPDIARVAISLSKEILIPKYRTMQPSKKTSKLISATDLSSFSFCPASYAIQATYNLKTPVIANMGEMMHDKQFLIFDKRKEIKNSFYSFAKTKNYRNLNSSDLTQEVKNSIMPLLHDIASSELIFYGHNTEKNKVFHNEDKTICGIPDYVFKRKDGTIFIVEEKFSLQNENTKQITKPYDNHRIQLGTYTMFLNNIKSSYGYILYWFYNFDRYRFPHICNAKMFKMNSSTFFRNEVKSTLQQTKEFQNKKVIDFKIEELNTWKCVNCITTELCIHKTGTIKNLHIPYNVGRQ